MRRLVCLSLWSLLVLAGPARGTDLRDVITDITLTSWNEKDGLPAATITALAQDRDGYLWVGSRQGLFRFDGVRFAPWDTLGGDSLPNRWVRSLLYTRQGDLWMGFGGDGQVARLAHGHLTVFSGAAGVGGGSVFALAEDTDGVIWAGTDQGLFRFEGGSWSREPSVQEKAVVGLFVDRAGALYAASSVGVRIRARGATAFTRLAAYGDTFGAFAQGGDGVVWVTDPRVGYRRLDAPGGSGVPNRQGRGLRMLVDRKGNLWTGTGGQGLWRTRTPTQRDSVERATSLTGLLGDGVYSLLEDRDGNIWAGTTEGLNRITPRTIEQIIDLGLVRAVDMDITGRVWVGTVDRLFSYASSTESRRRELPIRAEARAIAADGAGAWVASAAGVSFVTSDGEDRRFHPPGDGAGAGIEGVVPDGTGGLWLLASGAALGHWNGHRVEQWPVPDAVKQIAPTAAIVDRDGRVWIAFANGRLLTSAGGRLVLHPFALPAGQVVRTLTQDGAGRLWLGGDGVLARVDGDRALVLPASKRFPVNVITAIVPDDHGSIWCGASVGVVHLGEDEFVRAASDWTATPRYAVYTRSDGVAGTPVAVPFNRSAVRTRDGRIWFVSTRGLTVVDPHVLEARSTPAPVRFEGAVADDRRLPPGAPIALPAGTRKLEIDYTVVNLTTPLKSRFRYRLEPFDSGWVDAGGRRQAFYTNLKPGAYTFHVATAGASGDASSEASWPLVVEPRFYQTTAFGAASGVGVLLLMLGGWRLRERHLRKQFSLLIAERARLGREIHDTLLQGLVAIALQFDSLAHELGPLPRLQERFLRLRDRVEEYIREARRSIWDLHTQPPHRDLVESLRLAGEFATDGRDIAFTLDVQGTPYECPARVQEQVVRIAQEASLNSVRHAAPRQLRIALTYEDAVVTLRVADDGRGFDTRQARGGGHYGLTSMQERARSVGGALTLVTAPGQGTEVTAVLPIAS